MKRTLILLSLIAASIGAVVIAGCSTSGSPPTPFEQKFFTIHTNYLEVPLWKTNVIPVTVYSTNFERVTITNTHGVTEWKTNLILVPQVEYSNITQLVTSTIPTYLYDPNTNAAQIVDTGTAIGNFFGFGGAVGTGLAGLLALWARLRSGKNYATAANTAQIVETMRAFIQQLPNGKAYDAAMVQWMASHQAEAGVMQNVLAIIKNDVSNPDAQEAARQISDLIASMQGTPSLPPKS